MYDSEIEVIKEKKASQYYTITELEQQQFVINDSNGLMKGSEISMVTDQNDVKTTVIKSSSSTIYGRGGASSSLVMVLKTPHYWLFQLDEQVKQISCGDMIVLVGQSRRTFYLWRPTSDGCLLFKYLFNEEIDVLGFRRHLLVKTISGDVLVSDQSDSQALDMKIIGDLPFNCKEDKVVDIASGSTHSLMLTNSGFVYGSGQNYGQLGVQNSNGQYSESWILSNTSHIPDKIKRIYCTYNTSFLLTEKGHLYAAGDRSYGANGLVDPADPFVWTLVPNLNNEIVTDLRPGLFFVAILTQSHRIYVFGYFNFKQFGRSPNFVYDVNKGPKLLDSFSDPNNIQDIICGGYNSAILTKNNSVFIGGETSLINSDGGYTEFKWNQLLPHIDVSTSILKLGFTSDRLVISIHRNDISNYFNFRNIWKIADTFFNFE